MFVVLVNYLEMVNILFIVQELLIKNMYVCQPGFHVTFSAFTALTYIAKGIKCSLARARQILCSYSHARFLVSIERKSKTDLHVLPMWFLWLCRIIKCLRVTFLFLRACLSEIYLFCRI